MKKLKWGLLIAALVVCLLAVGCGGKDAGDQTATSDEAGESKEKGEPYEFTFVSNGDGTCYISSVRFNDEFADEELTLTFPEKSPTGDTVTAVRYQAKENAVPMIISDEDFLQYILQPIMVAEGKEPVQSTDVLSSSQMSAEQYTETLSFAARMLSAFYGGRDGKHSLSKTAEEHPDTEYWVFDTYAAEKQIARQTEYLMTIGMTPAKALQAEQRVGWASSSEFAYPDNVIAMEFPETVTEISKSVFFCMSLQSLSLPDGVKVVEDTNGWSTFECTPYYKEDSNWTDGMLYIGSVLVACKEDMTGSVTIKDGTTYIVNSAFSGYSDLTSITIPDSVTSIGDYAFRNCTGLTSITIPDSVTYIGASAFSDCTALKSVSIGNGVTGIGSEAFSGCTGLEKITIGNGVTSIGSEAFHDCTGLTGVYITDIAGWCKISFSDNPLEYTHNLYLNGELVTSVVIPDGVTYIGDSAFSGCTNLTSVVIPNSVTSIGNSAFSGCSGLESINIGNGVTSIGNSAFSGCTGLTGVYITDIAGWCKISFSDNPLKYAHDLYLNGELVTSVVIPNSVTSIGNSAFSGCTNLTSVVIPNRVTSIGAGAFGNCSGLTSITIPDSVTSIGNFAFSGCSGLTSITIPNSVTSIGERAFRNCSGLTSITIPDSVTSIGNSAFYDCSGLTSITIGNSVTVIDYWTFLGCSSLTSITIPDSVTSIGSSFSDTAYYNDESNWTDGVLYIGHALIACKEDKTGAVVIKDGTTCIAGSAFRGCESMTSITIPNSVTGIGGYAFYNCSSLTSINIPDDVTSIGDSAFSGCSSLTSINIPASVTSIGGSAFYGCESLTSITIPNSVTEIGSEAFSDCTGLMSVTIGNGVTSIGYSALNGCTSLTSITIPNSVTSIGGSAFYGCESLTRITIPDSVTGIGYSAFEGCTGLTSITIPDSVTEIGSKAFSGCTGLTSVTIGNGVTSIGWYAFLDTAYYNNESNWTDGVLYIGHALIACKEDKTGAVTIKDGTTCIADTAFRGCSGLTSITIPDSVTSIGSSAFYDCTGLTRITIPDSVTEIDSEAFRDCSKLTSITIGNGVTSIGESAFYHTAYYYDGFNWTDGVLYIGHALIDCETDKTGAVTIKDGTTCIADYAFEDCESLTSITIPDSVTSIGGYAFYHCSGLTSITFTGTKAQWEAVGENLFGYTREWGYERSIDIHCTDGDITVETDY